MFIWNSWTCKTLPRFLHQRHFCHCLRSKITRCELIVRCILALITVVHSLEKSGNETGSVKTWKSLVILRKEPKIIFELCFLLETVLLCIETSITHIENINYRVNSSWIFWIYFLGKTPSKLGQSCWYQNNLLDPRLNFLVYWKVVSVVSSLGLTIPISIGVLFSRNGHGKFGGLFALLVTYLDILHL